jgi:cation:H+ antiporter
MDIAASLILQILGLLGAIVLLWKGADLFVDGAVQIARRFKISELAIGLTLVGFGTSAPEFAVSIGAALTGRPDISVGNIVGSNIFNLGFILGGCAAVFPMLTSRKLVYRDGLFLIGVTVALAFFIGDLTLSRWEGALMILLLMGYLVALFRERSSFDDQAQEEDHEAEGRWGIPLGLVGLLMVLGGAHLLVLCASHMARAAGMSEWAIGVTIIAAGTSAPELVTCLAAAFKGKHGMSVGALIGSDLYNLLGVLGVASLISPLQIDPTGRSSVYLLVAMVTLVVFFMRTGWKIRRWEGLTLVGINLVRWLMDMGAVSLPG